MTKIINNIGCYFNNLIQPLLVYYNYSFDEVVSLNKSASNKNAMMTAIAILKSPCPEILNMNFVRRLESSGDTCTDAA